MKNLNKYYDLLIGLGATTQTLDIITSINGWNEKTFDDVLFCLTGYRSYNQYIESEVL